MKVNLLLRVGLSRFLGHSAYGITTTRSYLDKARVEPIVITDNFNEYVLLPREEYAALIENSKPRT